MSYRETGLWGSPRCESRLKEGKRSWRCILDAGHDRSHLSPAGGRRWATFEEARRSVPASPATDQTETEGARDAS